MEIHLDNGDILTLTDAQQTSLQAYVDHPQNLVPVFDPVTTYTTYKKRWETTDDWVTFIFNQALAGALSLVPPPVLSAIMTKAAVLEEERRKALEMVKL